MRQVLIRTTGRTCQIPRAYPRSTNITALSLIGVRTKSVHERHVTPVVCALVAHFTSAPCELSCQCLGSHSVMSKLVRGLFCPASVSTFLGEAFGVPSSCSGLCESDQICIKNKPRVSIGYASGYEYHRSSDKRKCVLWGVTSWMQGTFSDTSDCCSLSWMSCRPREAERPLCQAQAAGRATSLTKPAPTPKRGFRSGCIRLTFVSSVRSRRH